MKRFATIQIVYLLLSVSLIGGLTFSQLRGMRMLNVFGTGLAASKSVSRPLHK